MRVQLLGTVELQGSHGTLPLGGPRPRCLLAALAMTPGQSVPVTSLIERVWGPEPPANVRSPVYTYMSRLRKLVAEADGGAGVAALRRASGGYLLDIDPEMVDLHRARRLAIAARAAADAGDHPRAAELLAQACALWSDTPLAGLTTGWIDRVRVALDSERLALLTERFTAALRAGAHDTIIGPLSQALGEHPLTESLADLLMLALYRAGRHADALTVYTDLRQRMVTEVGDEPGAALRRRQEQILRRDPDLAAPAAATAPATAAAAMTAPATPPATTAPATPPATTAPAAAGPDTGWEPAYQLPPDTWHFIGRQAEVEQLVEVLRPDRHPTAVPLVAVTGTPGVGKSALATRVAQLVRGHYPDGQWHVRLGGVTAARESAQVAAELLRASGVDGCAIPDSPEQRTATLRSRLAGRRVLLLLDNAASAAQVRPLLPGTAGAAVIVTSRTMLSGLDTAVTLRLPPLPTEQAVELLGRLAGTERVAAAPAAAEEIAAGCGGLPLALRIAAARLTAHPEWTLERFAERLRDHRARLDELTTEDLAVRASLRLSDLSLAQPLRLALRRIGLLGSADFAVWAAGALCGRPDAERLVEGLVAANLLDIASTGGSGPSGRTSGTSGGYPRYRLHDLVAAYAVELAGQEPPATRRSALRRHLDALLALSHGAAHGLGVSAHHLPARERDTSFDGLADAEVRRLTADPWTWLATEASTVVAAIEQACSSDWHADAALLADRLLPHLAVRIGLSEAERLFATVRDAAGHAGDELTRWRAQCQAAALAAAQGRKPEAAATFQDCAAGFAALGATAEQAFSMGEAAGCQLFQNRVPEAVRLAEEAVRLAEACPDERAQVTTLVQLAGALSHVDRFDEALSLFDRALATAEKVDFADGKLVCLTWLAAMALYHGELTRADTACRQALGMVDEIHQPREVAYLRNRAARIATAKGHPAHAAALADQAAARLSQLGDAHGAALAQLTAGQARVATGDVAAAVPLLEASAATFDDLGLPGWLGQARQSLASVHAQP